ncbi:hypothetical protein [Agrococcus sp. ProA11]|uniref:hypothetical protein n=1 Tax=Agrococcus chionoecetis TaxID=3153752 RepID=UPI00326057F6
MAAAQHTDPAYDPSEHQAPADSGSASSFATRDNEFPPDEGHESAAHDPKTGAPVHGDGTPNADLPEHWQRGDTEGEDPAAQQVQEREPEDGEVSH